MIKKVILVLVEGPTDQDALALIFSKLIKDHEIKFVVVHTDITAGEDMTVKYIDGAIEKELEKYFRRNPFIQKTDILKVVQIIDTDGAFIPGSRVRQSETNKTEYFDTHIEAKDKQRFLRRNISKRSIVHHLFQMRRLPDSIPYEIYYFSRNLEQVLHDTREELTAEEKEELAFDTAEHYQQNPEEFLKFLREVELYVPGNYEETWEFIMSGGNSLKRYCNLAVFFAQEDAPS